MRRSFLPALLWLAAVASLEAAEIRPVDTSKPLFRVLKFQTLHGGDHSQGALNDEHPLLVVWAVRDLRLASDDKGVLITLTQKTPKCLAQLLGSMVIWFSTPEKVVLSRSCTLLLRSQMASLASSTRKRPQLLSICVAGSASRSSNDI
jgi:hypothetical protein